MDAPAHAEAEEGILGLKMQRTILVIVLMSAVTISGSGQDVHGKEDPATALWLEIKRQLTSVDAQSYFEANLKDSALPTLAGKLASATPRIAQRL